MREGMKTEHDESSQEEDESRHTLAADFFDFTDEKLIETETEQLNREFDSLQHVKNEEQKKNQRGSFIVNFLSRLHNKGDGLWHSLDFSKYDADAVFEAASQNSGCLATLQNESLFAQIVAGIAKVREKKPTFELKPHFV